MSFEFLNVQKRRSTAQYEAYTGALPPGKYSYNGEYVVETCPNCGKRDKLYFNVNKAIGFCYSCELRVVGKVGVLKAWPELEGRLSAAKTFMPVEPKVALLNPERFGVCAWDAEEPRTMLVGRGVSEILARTIPIWWLPQERCMAIMMDPLSPEYESFCWIRRFPDVDQKWRPAGPVRGAVYGFGLRYLYRGIQDVVLCEGLFDIVQAGLLGQGCALLGTRAADVWCQALRNRGVRRVTLWLDADDKGEQGLVQLLPKFRAWMEVRTLRTPRDPKCYPGMGPSILEFFRGAYHASSA